MLRIFDRIRLRSTQLRTVADRRFADAQYLCDSGQNNRANGTMYLAGFAVECLLKARLLDKYGWLGSAPSPDQLRGHERTIWSLCYRSHDLAEILAYLPEVNERFSKLEQGERYRLLRDLKSICEEWTIFARYSPHSANIHEAEGFLAQVKEVKEWLK